MDRRRWRRAWLQVHLWLGMAAGFLVAMVCVSGSLLVYRNELEIGLNRNLYGRAEVTAQLSPDIVLQTVRQRYPKSKVQQLKPIPETSSWIVTAGGDAQSSPSREIFVASGNPPQIRGERDVNSGLVNWIYRFHRDLLMGATGRNINGFVALALVVLELTGVLLWWPIKHRWRAAVRIRHASGLRRTNWDLHVVIGVWMAAPLLLFAVTGYRFCFPRTLSLPTALVLRGNTHDYEHFFRRKIQSGSPGRVRPHSFEELLHEAALDCTGCTLGRIIMPSGPQDAIEFFMQPQRFEQVGGFRSYFFDRWSGDLITTSDSSTAPASLQPLFLASPLHFGRWGGHVSRILSVLAGISPSVLFLTGVCIWWRRRWR